MKQETLKKWEQIYYYASLIVELDPWDRFEEKDIFALLPKGKKEEHFFSFLQESCGRCGIAFYRNGQAYAHAQERLYGKNLQHYRKRLDHKSFSLRNSINNKAVPPEGVKTFLRDCLLFVCYDES